MASGRVIICKIFERGPLDDATNQISRHTKYQGFWACSLQSQRLKFPVQDMKCCFYLQRVFLSLKP